MSFSGSPELKNSHPPMEFLCAIRMFVPGSNPKSASYQYANIPVLMTDGLNSLKTGACGDDPNGVICAAGCQGGMNLKIPNPGVSGDDSTAPSYACFCRSRTYIKATRTDARIITMARVVARAITAADMIGWLLVACLGMQVVIKGRIDCATRTRVS